jgi:predicted esterase
MKNWLIKIILLLFFLIISVNYAFSQADSLISGQPNLANIPPLRQQSMIAGQDNFTGHTKVVLHLGVPSNTPDDATVYMSGEFDKWSGGGNERYRFKKVTPHLYELELDVPAGSVMQFKFTRGNWETGEVDERGRRIGNRVLYVRDKLIDAEFVVSQWNDKSDETANSYFGYWKTPTPRNVSANPKPTLTLIGNKTVFVPSYAEYVEQGAIGKDIFGKDISEKITILESHSIISPSDTLITYQLKDDNQRVAAPVSRLIRGVDSQPSYSLRPVGSTDSHLGYVEQLPADYGKNPKTKYPLFIYHHGAGGEAASINLSPKTSLNRLFNAWDGGPARIAMRKHWNTHSPLIVLSPQRSYFDADIRRVDAFVDYAVRTYQVDPSRIYMGGFSAGGFISWEYAIQYPHKVAAIVPLAGGLLNKGMESICNAKDVSVWAFHSKDDKTVGVSKASSAVNAYNQCNPKNKAKLTLFDKGGHSIHQKVLELRGMYKHSKDGDPFTENLYLWLMSKKKTDTKEIILF